MPLSVPSSSRLGKRKAQDLNELTTTFQNATFLTDCSFRVTHDKLVQYITDVQPYEPHWEQLIEIELKNKGMDSLARLKEFLPRLERLDVYVCFFFFRVEVCVFWKC